MKLAIFGAQGYAMSAYEAIKTLLPKQEIVCFLVSKMDYNAGILGNIPVKEVIAFSEELTFEEKKYIEILIATPENAYPEIEEMLENYGFHYYQRLNSERWADLMKLFYTKIGRFLPLATLPVGVHMPFTRIYMAKSHKDRPLKKISVLQNYIFPIQVGADNCSERIADLVDNEGINISHKNGNYSELTGLYWIWKNKLSVVGIEESEKRQYFGLVQYRRLFNLSEDDLLRLVDNDVDIVLPYPILYEPNIHVHHKRYISDSDWDALIKVLSEMQPEYAMAFSNILEQRYLYNYNVILGKKKILREYCEWLFPILKRIEEISEPKGSERADRYIGYMGETLETLYFSKNVDRLNIVHTGCKLLT